MLTIVGNFSGEMKESVPQEKQSLKFTNLFFKVQYQLLFPKHFDHVLLGSTKFLHPLMS